MKRKQTLELRGSIVQVHSWAKNKDKGTNNTKFSQQGKQGTTVVNQRPNQSK